MPPSLKDTTTGITIAPGCCFGLENWRDWLVLMNAGDPWLGHGTVTHVERLGTLIHVWPDTDPSTRTPLAIPLVELPILLRAVHEQLNGFITLADSGPTTTRPRRLPRSSPSSAKI
ncbi:hypothetical protein [Streptomyces sp. NPDC051569]|uniref:hypothetical protein n=1 Tax=Streptomyces sp. NPDC051569 TaxID=3365661 RepID=UPI0037A71AFA